MSNGDKIRQMTNEELSQLICHCVDNCNTCPVSQHICDSYYGNMSCEEIVTMWLKQEVAG